MANDFTILVGTVGQGMNVSGDSGETWTKIRQPIPSESNIRALRTYPNDPHRILATPARQFLDFVEEWRRAAGRVK